jgi:PPOX class probable F420-dependent enzyme
VPITFALRGDNIITAIDHKPKTTASLQRLRNIEAHPFASVIIDQYNDDWSRLWWVRADGNAHVVRQGPDHDQAISWLADKYAPYRRHPPRGSVIVVEVDRWTSWSALE